MDSDVEQRTLRAPALLWLGLAAMVGFDVAFLFSLNSDRVPPVTVILLGASLVLLGWFFVKNPVPLARLFFGEKPGAFRRWAGGSPAGITGIGWAFIAGGLLAFCVGVVLGLTAPPV